MTQMATGVASIVRPSTAGGVETPRFDEKLVSTLHQRSAAGSGYEKIRADCYAQSMALNLPLPNEEWWRYTRADQFPWAALAKAAPVSFQLVDFKTKQEVTPAGIRLITGGEALASLQEQVQAALAGSFQDYPQMLQLALASGVAVIEIAPGARHVEPLLLRQILPAGATAATPVVVILVGEGSQCSIVEDLPQVAGAFSDSPFVAARVEIVAGQGCNFQFTSLQNLPLTATYFARHRVAADRDARVRMIHGAVGSRTARLDLEVRMQAPGAQVDMVGATLADGRRHLDFHPVQNHVAPHCGSNLYAKAVVKDEARCVYAGFIKVAEGAQKTDAYQKNRNLLLSSEARADSIPNLEIKANDVKCSHGASVGQMGEDEMFYLLSRGLTRAQAEKLLVEAFFEDLFAQVTDELLHEYLSNTFLTALQRTAA